MLIARKVIKFPENIWFTLTKLIAGFYENELCSLNRLGEEYQAISDKALSVPANTEELMDLIKFVNEVETVTLYQMEDRLREVMDYMIFLSDHCIFTPVEMKQNNITFQWWVNISWN